MRTALISDPDLVLRPHELAATHDVPVRVHGTDRATETKPTVKRPALPIGGTLHCRRHAQHETTCAACVALNGGAQDPLPLQPDDRSPTAPRSGDAVQSLPRVAPSAVELWPEPVPIFTYLAGAAGSGKTWQAREWASRPESGLLRCATTGIAAINIGGETINATLGFFNTASLQESYISGFLTVRLGTLWKDGVKRLIVDEVSMLDGDQLTYLVKAIEEVNGRGYVLDKTEEDETGPVGMGLTLVGDFAQLPPVKAPFAFESPEWARFAATTITLTTIHRQADPAFIAMLRAARVGDGERALEALMATIGMHHETDDHFAGPTVLARNDAVDRYNWLRMSRLPGRVVTFTSSRWGQQRKEWGDPEKPPATWGIPERLSLKIGSLVMILANERDEEKQLVYVNGDLGELVDA